MFVLTLHSWQVTLVLDASSNTNSNFHKLNFISMQLLHWNLCQICFANIDIRYEYLRISFVHIVLNKYSDDKNYQRLLLLAEIPYTINNNCKFTIIMCSSGFIIVIVTLSRPCSLLHKLACYWNSNCM